MKYLLILLLLLNLLFSKSVTKTECQKLKGNFIFAGGECLEYAAFDGEKKDKLIVIIHGAWKEGTNTLARYKPFAESLNLDTDITTVAIALPGYSKSSTNKLTALTNKNAPKYMSVTKEYIEFLTKVLEKFKQKYKAKELSVIAHSAGAMATATILGYKPHLIKNALLAGGRYVAKSNNKNLLFASKFLDKIPKDTNIILVYGTKDNISKPKETIEFYKMAKSKGLNVLLVEVKGHKHVDLDMSQEAVDAFEKLLEKN